MERSKIEAFFGRNDDENSLVCIELNDSRIYIGYIHGWEKPPYDDWIYFQEKDDTSGRMSRNIIKRIRWFHEKLI